MVIHGILKKPSHVNHLHLSHAHHHHVPSSAPSSAIVNTARRLVSPRVKPATHYSRVVANILSDRPCDDPIPLKDVYADRLGLSLFKNPLHGDKEFRAYTFKKYGSLFQMKDVFPGTGRPSWDPFGGDGDFWNQSGNERCWLPIDQKEYWEKIRMQRGCDILGKADFQQGVDMNRENLGGSRNSGGPCTHLTQLAAKGKRLYDWVRGPDGKVHKRTVGAYTDLGTAVSTDSVFRQGHHHGHATRGVGTDRQRFYNKKGGPGGSGIGVGGRFVSRSDTRLNKRMPTSRTGLHNLSKTRLHSPQHHHHKKLGGNNIHAYKMDNVSVDGSGDSGPDDGFGGRNKNKHSKKHHGGKSTSHLNPHLTRSQQLRQNQGGHNKENVMDKFFPGADGKHRKDATTTAMNVREYKSATRLTNAATSAGKGLSAGKVNAGVGTGGASGSGLLKKNIGIGGGVGSGPGPGSTGVGERGGGSGGKSGTAADGKQGGGGVPGSKHNLPNVSSKAGMGKGGKGYGYSNKSGGTGQQRYTANQRMQTGYGGGTRSDHKGYPPKHFDNNYHAKTLTEVERNRFFKGGAAAGLHRSPSQTGAGWGGEGYGSEKSDGRGGFLNNNEFDNDRYYNTRPEDQELMAVNVCWELASRVFKRPSKALVVPSSENLMLYLEMKYPTSKWGRGEPIATRKYPNGTIFVAQYANGGSRVYYPHGGLAMAISGPSPDTSHILVIRDPSDHMFFFDKAVLADLNSSGKGTIYGEDGVIQAQYSTIGGFKIKDGLEQGQRWHWNQGGQRILLKLNKFVSLRLSDFDKIYLCFNGNRRGFLVNVATGYTVSLMNLDRPFDNVLLELRNLIRPRTADDGNFDYERGRFVSLPQPFMDYMRDDDTTSSLRSCLI